MPVMITALPLASMKSKPSLTCKNNIIGYIEHIQHTRGLKQIMNLLFGYPDDKHLHGYPIDSEIVFSYCTLTN